MQTKLKVIETEKDLQRYFYSLRFYLVKNGIHKKTGRRKKIRKRHLINQIKFIRVFRHITGQIFMEN